MDLPWYDRFMLRVFLRDLQRWMGGSMTKIVAIAAVLGGIASILTGVGWLLTHFAGGALAANYQACLTEITAGLAVFTPGVQSMKVGPFARPAPPGSAPLRK